MNKKNLIGFLMLAMIPIGMFVALMIFVWFEASPWVVFAVLFLLVWVSVGIYLKNL